MALCQVEEAVFEGEEISLYEVKGILDLEDGRCIGDVLGRRSPVDVLPRITVTDVLQGPDDGDNRVARRLDLTADAGDVEIARSGFPRDLLCGSRRDEANARLGPGQCCLNIEPALQEGFVGEQRSHLLGTVLIFEQFGVDDV